MSVTDAGKTCPSVGKLSAIDVIILFVITVLFLLIVIGHARIVQLIQKESKISLLDYANI